MEQATVTVESAVDAIDAKAKQLKEIAARKKKFMGLRKSHEHAMKTLDAHIVRCDQDASTILLSKRIHVGPRVVELQSSSKTDDQEPLGVLLTRLMADRKSFTAQDAADAALAAGYKTRSKSFRDTVYVLMRQDTRFVRVRRGRYRIRASGTSKPSASAPKHRGGKRRGSFPNGMSLVEFIYAKAPKGKFCVSEIVTLARKAGAKASRASLSKSVSARLGEDSRFSHVGKGIWMRAQGKK